MPALQHQADIVLLEQYEALPADKRIEVFDGIAYDMAGPSQLHQALLRELILVFGSYIKKNGGDCELFCAPFDVLLSENPLTIVQPDLLIICDKGKLDENRCNGAPDFVIEIVSRGNPEDDYIRKLYYYRNSGVREYWIVDPRRKIVTVNYFEGNIVSVQYPFDAIIKVNLYDDLYVDFSELSRLLSL